VLTLITKRRRVVVIATVAVPLVVVILTLAGGWLVSTRVSDHWDQIKRRRESDQLAAEEFQRLYGKFFAAWKSWDAISRPDFEINEPKGAAWDCLWRATEIEGGVEALLAKISAERHLTADDVDVLGSVRQGFQSLRGAIKKNERLPWWGSEAEQYAAFKELTIYTTRLLGTPSDGKRTPTAAEAAASFREITSNKHEKVWPQAAKRLQPVHHTSAAKLVELAMPNPGIDISPTSMPLSMHRSAAAHMRAFCAWRMVP
jgi:hypothetical protein